MIHLLRVLQAAEEIQTVCQDRHWLFCFIGGVAVQRWGEPRLTQDADLTILTGFGEEDRFIDVLLTSFSGRRPDAREFALSNRVLLLTTKSGVALDVALGGLPFEERSIQRGSNWEWAENRPLRTCSAEDLIVHKAFAGRDLDWGDTERILIRQYGKLDLRQIRTELKPLLELKGDTEALDRLEKKIEVVDRRLRAKP
ncbi:MAG TPA: hypothetical protein VLT36_04840 [Candidatus Dormibacteraeota bacterium]|nr:hypothetical protein [Candidatus Dormibacteraeota bacterium]